jgi:outer membrane receptor protein involved in Fe transport
MQGRQEFENDLLAPGGYSEIYRNEIPTNIRIVTGKMDYSAKVAGDASLQAGWKVSSSHTDNTATYRNWINQDWVIDNTRSNHFVYQESIAAGYASFEKKMGRVDVVAGVRYEHTSYDAHQFGNSQQKDSVVSRNYGSLFPNGTVTYKMDSVHSFSLTASRRIDRPVFQTLNPFVYVINKYTYETGNPYILPQYSWTFELAHQYKELLTTTVSYTSTTNYFSQIFLSDTSKTILYYTQGNVGHVYNLGVSASVNVSPFSWWSLNLTAQFNHKQLRGFNGNSYTSDINQLNLNMNNQYSLGKGYGGELTGVYTTRARNDVQELLYPTGQASVGLSKSVMKKKGMLKLSYRDIFYTNAMEGLTSFPSATEYFKLKRDSRVLTLSFTYRFGRAFKVERRGDGAAEEKDRVQNG